MTSTQNGSVDGIRIGLYMAGSEHKLGGSPGELSLARAFVGAGMAVEVIEGVICERPDSAHPGVQIDAQGLEQVKSIESAPENKMMKRAYTRKAK